MTKIDFTAEEPCRRLDVFISDNSGFTRSRVQKLIVSGSVFVNGVAAAKASEGVREGETVTVVVPEGVPLNIAAEDIPIDVVYEDADLAVINKGQGMIVHPACGVYSGTLVNALLYRIKDLSGINGVLRPGIVHRLDKDTSGLLVVAKNDFSHVSLQRQIQQKTCARIYTALVEGKVSDDSGVIDRPIGRSKADRKKMDVVKDGRNAVTLFEVVTRYRNNTLMRFELKTGRTHQIRVHAKYMGHPVVGDKTYGYKSQRFRLDGQLLHAGELAFDHPRTGERMRFEAPLPEYFVKILKILEQEKTN